MTDEDQVRRLLADARHDEPMPDDVADRLDEVLAGLRDDRPVSRPVADHAARQRRKHVRNWVLAAAAVVVLGVGANQVDWSAMTAGDADSGGDSSAAMEDGVGAHQSSAPELDAGGAAAWRAARLQLTSDGFGDEVEDFRTSQGDHLLRHSTPLASAEVAPGDATASDDLAYSAICGIGNLGRGHRVPVRYDGERAWLVFRPVRGETQVVDLYLCGLEEPTRSITLPAP